MTITREIDLTWKGASKPFAPSMKNMVRIENLVRKETERPDFSLIQVMVRMESDPLMLAVVWGAMLHLAGHDRPDNVSEAQAVEYWYQQAWEAIASADKTDLMAARDAIFGMIAPSVDLGKPQKAQGEAKPRAKRKA
jgi:hypothetical protein